MDDKASSPSFEDLGYSYTHAFCSDHTEIRIPPQHTQSRRCNMEVQYGKILHSVSIIIELVDSICRDSAVLQ